MKLFLLLAAAFCFSCMKERQTFSYQKIYNSTNHTIMIIPFSNGVEKEESKKLLGPNSVIELEYRMVRGINNTPSILFDYFRNVDSLHVIFDNQYQVTHLLLGTSTSTRRNYTLGSNRNLGNRDSYILEKKEDNKYSRTWELQYQVTEQDYLYAH